MATIKVKIAYLLLSFFVIIGLENVFLDTEIIFPSYLETEILIHVCCGGHFSK